MKERTIEILLLFGIVFVSLGIVIWLARQYMQKASADTAKWMEAFQGVAKGGAAPMYRGDYDRPRYAKETRAQNQYTQGRYNQITQPVTNARVKFIRIEGKNDWLFFSQIAVFDLNNTNVAPRSSPSSSGTHRECHHHHHHGRHYNWRSVRHDDNHGCHTMRMTNAIDGNLDNPQNRWWDWGNPHDHGEGQTGGIFMSSSWSGPWFELNLAEAIYVRRIQLWQRFDWERTRISGFVIRLLDSSRNEITRYTLNSDQIQTFDGPALNSCPAGFRKEGDNYSTTCRQNCAAGETADNGNLICYRPCNGGDYLEGGTGGTCKTPCPAGFTLNGNTCIRNCVAPDTEIDLWNCYRPCAAGEDSSRPPKCYRVCPSTHRLIEDQCFPNEPETYLSIAWRGTIISEADSTQNVGLCLPIDNRGKNGDRVGVWGPIGSSATDNVSDQTWAYTENMLLVNMNNRKCLDTALLTKTPTTWDCHGDIQQRWFIDSESRIRSVQYPDRCLTTDTANGYNTNPVTAGGDPKVRLTTSRAIDLQPCTNDGSKFQRWRIPAVRVGLNQAVGSAAAPPALPSEPLNRDGFTDGSNSSEALADNAFKE